MRMLDRKSGAIQDVPDPIELPIWRDELLEAVENTPVAEPLSFQKVESEFFDAQYGKKGRSIILQIKPLAKLDEDDLGQALVAGFSRDTFPGEWVPEVESWVIRVEDPPEDWDDRMMLTLQTLENRIEH